MNLDNLIGQTLDSKYLIEKELGRGGMGAVYLATHVGTERPVAVKVIVPQFMQRAEFVERFRREARAAGRLRHPNVVDVTDFGIADTGQERVAYLVMEYLDGCTLGEILEEEKQLPLSFTLDILEQVCSAVHEAHEQGIIHRDLKPDNIWLEPNQRGGYTVKVLDFGIAKLEEPMNSGSETSLLNPTTSTPTQAFHQGETISDSKNAHTVVENRNSTAVAEAGTLIQSETDEKGTAILSVDKEGGTAILSVDKEGGTAILPSAEISSEDGTAIFSKKGTQLIEKDEKGTRLLSSVDKTDKSLANLPTKELTRVGAVLGTPLYMSPEQCRGEKLSPRSDIYSLAVIAYQMLSGKTPFEGDFTQVMDAHKEIEPPPLNTKKIPRKVKKVLFSALAKNTEDRPQTAEAFANKLRSHSEGFGRLLQRALVIYSEHLPKFLLLAILLALPNVIFSLFRILCGILASVQIITPGTFGSLTGLSNVISFFVQVFSMAMLVGTVTWIVAQILATPLRPVSLRDAFKAVWAKKRNIFLPVTIQALLSMVGYIICLLPGIYFSTVYMLITPSIIMEDARGRGAFRRSKQLVNRSFLTSLAIALLMFFVPATIGLTVGTVSMTISRQFESSEKIEKTENTQAKDQEDKDVDITLSPNGLEIKEKNKEVSDEEKQARALRRVRRDTISQIIVDVLMIPIMILMTSLTSVITALMYFKTRQAGGESMQDLLAKFEDAEHPRSNWQHRIRERLIQSGRVSSTEKR